MAIGPVFGTGTKDTGYDAVGLDTVRRAAAAAPRATALPTVAIGGITLDERRVGDRGRRRVGGGDQRSVERRSRSPRAALSCECSNKTHL